ncbi:MAG: PrsW family intramembrane metalloprotease [Bacteroidetes bacterium]|nr:PrsW family intramembrane metalloprotease [Bacteroidota bacterium]
MITQLFLAIFPVIVLGLYVYIQDANKEPWKLLLKAFIFGMLSAVSTLALLSPVPRNYFYQINIPAVNAVLDSFCFAAIPEETLKFLFLFLLIWWNKEFDEFMDGIVYSVFVSLGFAAFENVLYLYNSSTFHAIARGIFSVPGHFLFAVVMGYYFALGKFSKKFYLKIYYLLFGLLFAIVMHGVFDSILGIKELASSVNSYLGIFVFIIFIIFDIVIWRVAVKKIQNRPMP